MQHNEQTVGRANPVKTGLIALLIVGLIGGIATIFHMRASAKAVSEEPDPLPVATIAAERQAAYTVTDYFVGRIEAAQRTLISFERPGLVDAIHVDEGDEVSQGDVLAELDRKALRTRRAQLAAQLNRAEADAELADLTAKRQKELLEKGHASTQRFDEARLNAQAARARLSETKAAIRSIDIDLSKSEVRAPFAATIGMRMLDPGAVVNAGSAVVELLAEGAAQARIGVSLDAAGQLEPGQTHTVIIDDKSYTATVVSVRPDLSPQTRTVDILLAIEAADAVAYGETVALALERGVPQQGFWLPNTALIEGRKGLWTVYVVQSEADTKVIRREAIEIVHFETDRAFVTAGFADGTKVVAGGVHRVIPGQKVLPQPVRN